MSTFAETLFMTKDIFVKNQKATSIRLGDLKAPLQKKAMTLDRSLNWYVCKILKDHILNDVKEKVSKT